MNNMNPNGNLPTIGNGGINFNITSSEADSMYIGLGMRRNLIQTGDPMCDIDQAVRERRPIKKMDSNQMRIVLEIEELMSKILFYMR